MNTDLMAERDRRLTAVQDAAYRASIMQYELDRALDEYHAWCKTHILTARKDEQ